MTLVLVLAMALASIAVVAAEARAGSHRDGFPKTVLMEGRTELQEGRFYYGTWHRYVAGEWYTVHADGIGGFPRADVVGVDSKLRIKIDKPQRPERFAVRAYARLGRFGIPEGEGERLDTTLRRVERDGRTAGWNVVFHVEEPDRHYYLETRGRWERVPDSRISFGSVARNFHVKTTD